MKYLALFLFILLVALFCTLLYILLKYIRLRQKYIKKSKFLKKAVNSINSIRWGNLYERIEKGYDRETKSLSEGLNELAESILDREKMIREYIEKEKESNMVKADFMATLTHDLKVPIVAQDNTFQLFLDGRFGDISDMQKEVIKKLKASNMDLKHLVDALLETYKIENAGIKIQKKEGVNIEEFVKNTIDEMSSIINVEDKKIDFKSNLEEKTANFDTFLIKRVLQNILINAITNSKKGDTVEVELDKVDDKKFKIIIKDHGIGIGEEEIKKIFEKYYSNSTKYSRSGIGLGLYLSNKIIKMHKGKIDVKSKEGRGSVFSVILNYK